jgi:RNAse (barnase) inhibitor barstar
MWRLFAFDKKMPNSLTQYWREHLLKLGAPHVHFVEEPLCEPDAVVRAGTDLDFVTIELDASRIGAKIDFMNELSAAAKFPAYFGQNWDSVSDLLRDLSWMPAKGYVLLITNGDHLMQMESRDIAILFQVIEAAIQNWRDERGEYNERTTPIPFHLVLCGANELRTKLAHYLTEPFCDHPSTNN